MRIDPAGLPFIGGALALGLILGRAVTWLLLWPFLLLGAFFLFFFRDPERRVPSGDDEVLSPADGRVLVAGEAGSGAQAGGPRARSASSSPPLWRLAAPAPAAPAPCAVRAPRA